MKHPEAQRRSELLTMIAGSWVRIDPTAAIDFALTLPAGQAQNIFTRHIIDQWAAADPRHVGGYLVRLTPTQRNAAYFSEGYTGFMQTAPAEALRVALETHTGPGRYDSISRALKTLVKRDPILAKKKLDELPDGPDKVQIIQGMVAAVAPENPEWAALWLAKLPAGPAQANAVLAVAQAVAFTEPAKALEWVKTVPASSQRNQIYQMAIKTMAASEPSRAMAEALAMAVGETRNELVREVAGQWGPREPRRAHEAVLAIEDVTLRHSAGRVLALVVGRTDPVGSLAIAQSLPAGEARTSLVAELIKAWAQADALGAVKWLDEQTDLAVRAAGYGAVISALTNFSAPEAAKLVAKIPAGEERIRAISQVLDSWGRSDPVSAARWTAALPPDSGRTMALPRVVMALARADFNACAAWLETLPVGFDRDRAIQTFVNVVAVDRAAQVADWVDKISDPSTRFAVIETIARQWMRVAPEAAKAWLVKTDLPAERRDKVRPAELNDHYR